MLVFSIKSFLEKIYFILVKIAQVVKIEKFFCSGKNFCQLVYKAKFLQRVFIAKILIFLFNKHC